MSLKPPRIVDEPRLTIVGIDRSYRFEEMAEIPGQWQHFVPSMDAIVSKQSNDAYGISHRMTESGICYFCGIAVTSVEGQPNGLDVIELPAQRYAAFEHPGHVSELCNTIDSIWKEWLPSSGHVPTQPAVLFEKYGPGFCPDRGSGDIEVWMALQS
ncbi:MAG: AraC family transcriptional regulator [Armatimonadetes bacterium]|nr:AraC family transcriptional regulator [Armatimonadota bacterium]